MPIPYVSPKFQAIDSNGSPLVGGKLYTYTSGTTTPQATFQDAAGTINNTNPIILNSRGEAIIFLSEQRTYTFVLRDSQDALIWSQDGITGSGGTSSGITVVTALPAADIGPVYMAGQGIFSWDGSVYSSDYSQGFGGGAFGHKNRIINGDFQIWARANSIGPITSASSNPYTANNWRAYIAGTASVTVANVNNASDYGQNRPGLQIAQITSNATATPGTNDLNAFVQHIEGSNVLNLALGALWGGNMALSFWVKASIPGTYSVALRNNGSPGWKSYVCNYVVNVANTWELKKIIVPIDQSGVTNWDHTAGIGLSIAFDLGSGSAQEGALNSWLSTQSVRTTGSVRMVATSGSTISFSRVQLEQGAQCTPFELRLIQTEYALTQRTYQVSGGTMYYTQPGNGATITQALTVPFKVSMRAAPSIAITQVLGTTGLVAATSDFATFFYSATSTQLNQWSWTASAEL